MKRLIIYDLDGVLADTPPPYQHSRLYPGTQRLLDHFRGRTQVILTDRPNPFAQELLEALGILGYFADIVAGDSPYPRKPHPAGALALMARAGVTPEEALLIGDRATDIETGRNAGVLTVAVSHGSATVSELRAASPDVLAEDLFHLRELARQYRW